MTTWLVSAEILSIRDGEKKVLNVIVVVQAEYVNEAQDQVEKFFASHDLHVRVWHMWDMGLNLRQGQ